ncbi:MAG: magnesium transporter [candidate division WOR-3 bacterium]
MDLVRFILPDIAEALSEGHYTDVKKALSYLWPQDIVELLALLPPKEQVVVFRLLDKETAGEVFSELDHDLAEELLEHFTGEETRAIVEELDPDDRAALFSELPPQVVKRIMALISKEDKQEVLTLLGFPEDSAGRVMSTDFLEERESATVGELLERIRQTQPEEEALYQIMVTDDSGVLLGTISAVDLLKARPDTKLSEIMESPVPTVRVDEPAEEAARMLGKYNLLALPVVDADGELIGVITADDVIDIQTAEATEDFQRLMAIAAPEERYFGLNVWGRAWRRTPWLVILIILGIIPGIVIQRFEAVLGSFLALSYFIPMLADTGGNMGSQAVTLIVRGIATGEFQVRRFMRFFLEEIAVALLIGFVLGITTFVIGIFRTPDIRIAITAGTAMLSVVIASNLMGFFTPLFAKYVLRVDPAVVSSPLITTLVDATGLAIYFGIAIAIMRL